MMLNCGHYSSVWQGMSGIAPGYGYLEGYSMCYGCMYVDQVAQMSWATTFFVYQGASGIVTDWVGNRLGNITRSAIKGGAASQLMVWVTDLYGQHWYGTGPTESGTYLRLRKIKAQS